MNLNRIAIAGITEAGETVIEVIELGGLDAPVMVPSAGGQATTPVFKVTLERRTIVYRVPYDGENWITLLWGNRGIDTSLMFCSAKPPRKIIGLDIVTRLQTVLAQQGTPGVPARDKVLQVDNLDRFSYMFAWDGNHQTLGHIYTVGSPAHGVPGIYLIDGNRDGELDKVLYTTDGASHPLRKLADYKDFR